MFGTGTRRRDDQPQILILTGRDPFMPAMKRGEFRQLGKSRTTVRTSREPASPAIGYDAILRAVRSWRDVAGLGGDRNLAKPTCIGLLTDTSRPYVRS